MWSAPLGSAVSPATAGVSGPGDGFIQRAFATTQKCDHDMLRRGYVLFAKAFGGALLWPVGVQAGYNWQIEQTVLGIEADWQYLPRRPSGERRRTFKYSSEVSI
jgi:hypothetical protein